MAARNVSKSWRSAVRKVLAFWPLLLPLFIFLPGLNGFPYPSLNAPYSDLVISHYPNALYIKRALSEWGVVPLWSPTILSGYPFAANPLSGLWYPLGWVALVFPLPLGFNLMAMAHLLLGGVGLYRLLRLEGLTHVAALFGALTLESLPKLFAHYGAGHLTLVYAVSWTPWLLVAHVSSFSNSTGRYLRGFAPPGLILALIFLADPRWMPYAGALWLFFTFAHRHLSQKERTGENSPFSNLQLPISNIQYLISNLILSAFLAAPLALPLLEYTWFSTRSSLAVEDIFAHSLPLARLLGLVFPDFGGHHEWMLYPGGAVLVLLLLALLADHRRKQVRFWAIIFVLSALYALGSNLPLLQHLARIPGFDLLRVPARSLFLMGLAGAVLASFGLDALLSGRITKIRAVHLGLTGLSAFCVLFVLSVRLWTGHWVDQFLWGGAAIFLGSLWVMILLMGGLPRQIWLVGLFGMAILDWGAVNASVLSFRPPAHQSSELALVGRYLADQAGPFRVYSPSYSLPQDVAARHGLQLADGVDPLQLTAYAEFMDVATGVPRDGYSVTLPSFAEGDPSTDNAAYRPVPEMLGLLNVGYVVAAYELPVEGLVLQEKFEELWIYENTQALPRAWIQPDDTDIGSGVTPAVIEEWQSHKITIQAQGPGLLVLSEIAYPGWGVRVDGEREEVETPFGLLRGVMLEAGKQEVVFYFRPTTVYLGLGCFAIGVVLLVLRNRFQRPRPR